MKNIYQTGEYLEKTVSWHMEDSPWKATQIDKILATNDINPTNIVEIGCGAGGILESLTKIPRYEETTFTGYDISPQAIDLCGTLENQKISFINDDLLCDTNTEHYDLLLAIDVFEHVPDYMGFLTNCQSKADLKVYHIPLEIYVYSALRDSFLNSRNSVGHLHYFSTSTALATLKDTGHEIIDYFYTNGALDQFRSNPTPRVAFTNIPRWLVSKISTSASAKLFGGFSLLVLAK